MKKLISLLLVLTMCLSLFAACGGTDTSEQAPSGTQEATAATTAPTEATQPQATGPDLTGKLSVGYSCVDVTPTDSVPLGGYGNSAERFSTSTGYPIHAVTVAFTDAEGETVLYVALDLLLAYGFADTLRDALAKEFSLPKDHIMIHCDHNHSGPDMNFQDPSIALYAAQLSHGVLASAKTAMNDRKPVTGMGTAFTRPEKVNFVRHYLLADGNYQAEGVGAVPKDQLIGHATVADNLLQALKFTREGGKDVVLMNWQGHPRGTGDDQTIVTGNYYSVMRTYVDKNMDCHSVFILSGSGNLNNNSQIPSEVLDDDYVELGETLGKHMVGLKDQFVAVDPGTDLIIKENMFETMGNSGMRTVPLYAMTIGDFAMVMAPFEIFDTNARGVREASDYKMTFYSSCTNKSMGYLPTPMSFDWEIAYEVRITNFPKGTAELIQEQLTNMLSEMYTATGKTPEAKPEGYIQPEFVPDTDGKTYTNPAPGSLTSYTAVNNGFYALQLLDGMKIKNVLCISEEVAKKVLAESQVQLIFNEQNVVVDIVK